MLETDEPGLVCSIQCHQYNSILLQKIKDELAVSGVSLAWLQCSRTWQTVAITSSLTITARSHQSSVWPAFHKTPSLARSPVYISQFGQSRLASPPVGYADDTRVVHSCPSDDARLEACRCFQNIVHATYSIVTDRPTFSSAVASVWCEWGTKRVQNTSLVRRKLSILDNTAKRCGVMAVLHIIYYDIWPWPMTMTTNVANECKNETHKNNLTQSSQRTKTRDIRGPKLNTRWHCTRRRPLAEKNIIPERCTCPI